MALINISLKDYPKTILINPSENRNSTIMEVLPFRIRFTNIGLEPTGYTPINPAPIGIAIVGFNNYIL